VCAVEPSQRGERDAGSFFGRRGHPLIQCTQNMADWKQITARIRRARSGKDPLGQLANLYEKTSDAMVAFELAKLFENSGQNSDAAKWYSTAAARFRRAEWKSKAQEAAVRLGGGSGEIPAPSEEQFVLTPPMPASEEKELAFERNPEALESVVAVSSEIQEATKHEPSPAPETGRRRQHRGRRGGRNRRRAQTANGAAGPLSSRTAMTEAPPQPPAALHAQAPEEEEASPRLTPSRAIPSLSVEPLGETSVPGLKGRYGDPGLSSRLSLLEMQFRRLLACPPAKLSEGDRAPAGPGVLVLTDSDLTTYYYVEVCQTLRIAVSNLLRGGSRRGADSIKPRLAEHLGISEARVAKYLADHCVVRWLQLDEGASHFAHFTIAVLRPVLNE
jgi:hypothetical protein